jgi:type IV pilus assembly protein PilB
VARIRLGDMLVQAGLIDELQLQSALAHQRQWGGKLGDILVNNGFLDEMMLWRGLSKQLGVPLVCLPEQKLATGIESQVPQDLCVKNAIFPIHRDDKGLTVATSDPGNIGGLDDLAFRLGFRLRTVLAPDREIEWAIRRYFQGDPAPCPPPRMRRVVATEESGPTLEVGPAIGNNRPTPMADLAEIAARAQQQAQQQAQLLAQQQAA